MVFNLQGSEVIVILLLALVVLGPEKLPDAIRKFSRTYGELKKMGSGFGSELKSALDEPMREMRETGDIIRNAADPSTYVDKTPSAPAVDAPLTPDPADAAAGAAARAATAATGDDVAGSGDDVRGPVEATAAAGADDEYVESADPSDPGSTTVATPGDPPTPSGPPINLIEARRDGKITPTADGVATDGVAADGAAGNGSESTDETATA